MVEKIGTIAIISLGTIYLFLLMGGVILEITRLRAAYHSRKCNKSLIHHPDRAVKICLYCGYETTGKNHTRDLTIRLQRR